MWSNLMNLIERYLQAVSRELPPDQREDILKELRSSLYDALEAVGGDEASDEQVSAILKEMGSPREVAASYYPAGQYVVGPALYPTFLTVLKIVITVMITVQVVLITLSLAVTETPSVFDELGGLMASIPAAVGYVVLIFWGIQRTSVQPEPEAVFDPRKLPPLEAVAEPVSRFEQFVSMIANVIALAFLVRFAQAGGFNVAFFDNPVIRQFLPWLVASFVVDIALDIVLLWRGRWDTSTRIAGIVGNLFGLVVLYVVLQGHNAWLAEAGISQSLLGFADNRELFLTNLQAAGMVMFRFGIAVAMVIIGVEMASYLYKLVRARLNPPTSGLAAMATMNR
jgi:hypothetical protein